MSAIYKIIPSTQANVVDIDRIWTGSGIASGLKNFVQFSWEGGVLLLGQDVQSYKLTASAPFVAPVASNLDLVGPCGILQPFVVGGQWHLIAYRSQKGELSFHRVNDDLTLSKPFKYHRMRSPGLTTGWTMMQPFTYLGLVYYLDTNTGAVELFWLNVTPTSDDNVIVRPLIMSHGAPYLVTYTHVGQDQVLPRQQ